MSFRRTVRSIVEAWMTNMRARIEHAPLHRPN